MNKQVDFLIKLRDSSQQISDAANQLINSLAPPEVKAELAAVEQSTFSILKFEPQQGAKLGEFEIAKKENNQEDKWQLAHNILSSSNATIKDRYHGQDYQYSYWLYSQGTIYRQKLKPKT
mgnify:CR=1 FL=1